MRKAASTAKVVLYTLTAKAPPQPPPPHIAALGIPGSSDILTPEQQYLALDPEGRKEQLAIQVINVSAPSGPLAKEVASATYDGYSIIHRAAHLSLIGELIQFEFENLDFGLTLSDPLKIQRLAQSFVSAIRQASSKAEADLETSSLWNTFISQGCGPEAIREDCLSPQDERFRRVAELTALIFTKHGLRSGPRPIRKSQETDSDEEEENRDQEDEVPDDEDKLSESSVETNAAWDTLYTFNRVIANLTGLEPPGRIYNSLNDDKNFKWCELFVKVIELEVIVRRHRKSLIDHRTSRDWISGTSASYEATGLRKLYLDSLVDSDRESGFSTLPLDAATAERLKTLPLQPANELEPSGRPKQGHVNRSGRLSSKNIDSYADGCFARALATSEAVKTASLIIIELLEFSVEGVTCFQDRIALTLCEAAEALREGGHSDFLHREFTLCIALVLSLFFKASGAVAILESRRNKAPSTPARLCKDFEREILRIVTDPYGLFKIIPGSYPEVSVARKSAQEFIGSVLIEAIDASYVPVDGALSACLHFYYQALEDRGKDLAAEAAADEAVQIQLAAFEEEDSASRPPWRPSNKFVPIQEQNRNPGQVASSSSGPDPTGIAAEPANQGPRPETSVRVVHSATAECVPTDPKRYSPVSEITEVPPPTDELSVDEEAVPLV